MQAWNTLGQRPAAVTNPVVRVLFCDGPFFTNAAMTVATATTNNSAAIRCRRYVGLCPCPFRGTGFDQKKTLVVHPVVFLSHPLDHSVAHINRIKCHIAFVPTGEPYAQVYPSESFTCHVALTRQELLSTIEPF